MDNSTSFSSDLRGYLGLLAQWSWLIVLAMILAGASAYFFSQAAAPTYRASTLVLVNQAPSTKAQDYNTLLASQYLTGTYAQVMTTRPVIEGVIERLALSATVVELQAKMKVEPVRETQLIRIEVENTDPGLAALIANTIVDEFIKQNLAEQSSRFAASKQALEAQLAQLDNQIQSASKALSALGEGSANQAERSRLENLLAQYRQSYTSLLQSYEALRLTEAQTTSAVVQKEPAVPPAKPVQLSALACAGLAAAAGLVLAIGLVFLIEALDDTLRDPEDISRHLGLPLLGRIAHHAMNGSPVAAGRPRSPAAESFRSLRAGLQFASPDRPLRSLLVTSPSPKDGKSTVACSLAVVFAQGERRVALVDADLRRPGVHTALGLPDQAGLSDLLLQLKDSPGRSLDLGACLQASPIPDLYALTAGSPPLNPSELLGSRHMQAILQQLSGEVDLLLLDSPPVLAVADAVVLAGRVDGVLLVVKPGATRLGACREAVEQLRRAGANLLGVVLNDVGTRRSRYALYHYKGCYNACNRHPYNGSSQNGRRGKNLSKI